MATYEFGRLVNRLSDLHALKNVMRWGFLMGVEGFAMNQDQANAIRRFCLNTMQSTEWDNRLKKMYGDATNDRFVSWYQYWFDPTSTEVYYWFEAAFAFLMAFERTLNKDAIPASHKPLLFQESTFEHILNAAQRSLSNITKRPEQTSADWVIEVQEELQARPNARWEVMHDEIMVKMETSTWGPFRDANGKFGPDERYTRELFTALVGAGNGRDSLLFELYRTILGNLGTPDVAFQSYMKGFKTDRGRYADAFAALSGEFQGKAWQTYEWVPCAYDVELAWEDRMVQGPNVGESEWVAGWERLQQGDAMHRTVVGRYFIWGDVYPAATDAILFQIRENGPESGNAEIEDTTNWPWNGERSFVGHQMSQTHYEAVRDIVWAPVYEEPQEAAPSKPPPSQGENKKRLVPDAATDPSDRKRRRGEKPTDPEEDDPVAKRQRQDPPVVAPVPAEMEVEKDAADGFSYTPIVMGVAAMALVAGGVAYQQS